MGDKRGGEGKTIQPRIYRIGLIVSVWKDIWLRAQSGGDQYPNLSLMEAAYGDKINQYIRWASFGEFSAHVDIFYHNNTLTNEYYQKYDGATGQTNTVCTPQKSTYDGK